MGDYIYEFLEALNDMLSFKNNKLGNRFIEICYGILAWIAIFTIYLSLIYLLI